MNVLSFVNSKDIREHLRKINYQFNSIEAAWLIYQCKNATIREKQSAFNELICTMPDCEIKERLNTVPQKSLHKFLRKYIALQNKYIDEFMNSSAGFYQLTYIYDDYSQDRKNLLYSSFEKAKETIRFEEDIIGVECIKVFPNQKEKSIVAKFSTDSEMTDIELPNSISGEEYDIYYGVFDGFCFDFPTPFKKGDIVYDKAKKYGFCGSPFVVTDVGPSRISKQRLKGSLINDGDASDMTAGGYFQREDGLVYYEVMHNYMDLEYYGDSLIGIKRVLTALGNYEKGKIDESLLLSAYHFILAEQYAKHYKPNWFTKEGMHLAGLAEDD